MSTTSDADLSRHDDALLRFSRELPELAVVSRLRFLSRWYVGSRSGCSCGFRHLHSIELGFGEPVDWYPEEPEDIEATRRFIGVVRALVAAGQQVDCIDVWQQGADAGAALQERAVDLDAVADGRFRLFENHHFVFQGTGR